MTRLTQTGVSIFRFLPCGHTPQRLNCYTGWPCYGENDHCGHTTKTDLLHRRIVLGWWVGAGDHDHAQAVTTLKAQDTAAQENTNNPMLRLISSSFCTLLSLLVSVALKNSACFPTESQASHSQVSLQLTFNLDETPEEEESTFTTHPLSPPLPPVHKREWGKWWAKAQLTIDPSHPWPLVPSTDHSLVTTERYVALPLAHWLVHNFNGIYGLERTQRWLVSTGRFRQGC